MDCYHNKISDMYILYMMYINSTDYMLYILLVYCSYYSVIVILIDYDKIMLNNYFNDVYNVEEIAHHHNSFQLLIKKIMYVYLDIGHK